MPVNLYWSVTIYDRTTHTPDSRSALVEPFFPYAGAGAERRRLGRHLLRPATAADRNENWIPTQSDGAFEVLFRFYGPEKPLFDKSWRLPDIQATSV